MVTKPSANSEQSEVERTRTDAWLGMERAEKIPELLARRILREITQKNLGAGDRLPSEAEMLAQFGAGRASLREALRILEIHGIIRIKPGPHGGPRVTDLSPSDFGQTTTVYLQRAGADFQELLEARLVVEPVMARLAAQRLTPENAERIRAAAEWGWEAVDASAEVWSAATEEFHTVVAGASGNRVLDLQASSLISIERNRVGPIFNDRKDRERTLRIHDRIAEAILGRDAVKAEELSRKHIQAVAKVMEANLGHLLAEKIEWK
jgi:GntR family transcriptional repressor for pyruvate dehydrogenase complex